MFYVFFVVKEPVSKASASELPSFALQYAEMKYKICLLLRK
jgi:hypothetical protein